MDKRDFEKAILALRWDERYGKERNGCKKDESTFFLPQIHCIDPDFRRALTALNITTGDLLDIGTGLGSQAIHFAQIGFEVTATDISSIALAQAIKKAEEVNARVAFINDNILHTALDEAYDVITDRGCLSLINEQYLADYLFSVSRLLRQNGHFFLKIDRKNEYFIKDIQKLFRIEAAISTIYQGESKDNLDAKFYHLTHFSEGITP